MDDDMRVWMVTLLLALPIGMLSPGVGADPDPVPGGPDGGSTGGTVTLDHTWADAVDAYGWEESRAAFDAFVEAVEADPGDLSEDDIQALRDLNYGLTREGKGFDWFETNVNLEVVDGSLCVARFTVTGQAVPVPVVAMPSREGAGVGVGMKYVYESYSWTVHYLGIAVGQSCSYA